MSVDDSYEDVNGFDHGGGLKFACPRCGNSETDSFEVIDVCTLTDWRCGACRRMFNVLLFECPRCGKEDVHVGLQAVEQPSLTQLACSACCWTPQSHDAD